MIKRNGGNMLREKVEVILDKIREDLKTEGGDIELVDVTVDGTVKVKFTGGCCGCPSATATLTQVVESAIKAGVPEVKKIELA